MLDKSAASKPFTAARTKLRRRPTDRADFVERPATRHRTGTGHSAEGRTQAHCAASGTGRNDRAQRLRSEREPRQAGSCCRYRTGARPARSFLSVPGVAGLAAIPDGAKRQGLHAGLSDQDPASGGQSADHLSISFGDPVCEWLGTAFSACARASASVGVVKLSGVGSCLWTRSR